MQSPPFRRTLHRLLTLLMAVGFLAGARPFALDASTDAPSSTEISSDEGSTVLGSGPDRNQVLCIACASTIVAASGTHIFGLVILSSVFGEAVVGCALLCTVAYT